MPLQATSGAASYDAFGGGVAAVPNYIEDVFSTYLYTGNGSTQTITNGIDLAGKGGLVWLKARNSTLYSNNMLADTAQGANYWISSNRTDASDSNGDVSSFNSNGFGLRYSAGSGNPSGIPCVSWTFRKQPKFFDVVTWTGDGTSERFINHNLQSAPGCIIMKCTSSSGNWFVWHIGNGGGVGSASPNVFGLNSTNAAQYVNSYGTMGNSSIFYPTSPGSGFNNSGQTYVAYLFANNTISDPGNFGLTGTDNVISCGSFTTNGSGGATVSLGYEPQFVLFKKSSASGYWYTLDNMRGMPVGDNSVSGDAYLYPNVSGAESVGVNAISPNATGFVVNTGAVTDASSTYIYIAIRRGPMKVPTSGTSVFSANAYSGVYPSAQTTTTNFPVDFLFNKVRNQAYSWGVTSRLTATGTILSTNNTASESAGGSTYPAFDNNTGVRQTTADDWYNASGLSYGALAFRRAPSFFDEVCYTGNGVNSRMVTHNLGVQPELLIIKRRDDLGDWSVAGKIVSGFKIDAFLNKTAAFASGPPLDLSAEITSTAFQPQVVGNYARALNTSGGTYVAYLFATCAGVSKVGSYTGTGTTKQVDCGFTGGARFVLIKRTDDLGAWYVWDSARGIVAGNDPYLLLNSTAAEVTSTDYIDTYSAGFEISSTAPDAINASGDTYIFLAIA